jgi:thiol-disulfide isomerase/thioredoxin
VLWHSLPHNEQEESDGMKKYPAIALVTIGALALLAIGGFAARSRRTASFVSAGAGAGTSLAKPANQDDSADGESKKGAVIRFASNPTSMPPFLLSDVNGQVISTADLRGKVVLLSFWATWCPPCREEIPELIELANKYQDKLMVIGVSMDDALPQSVAQFARKAGINYPIVMGGSGISDEYGGVAALPTSFVIDTNGKVVQKHIGLYPTETYDNEIRALLGMPVNVKVETFVDDGQIFLKNATELPGVDFTGLTPAQRKEALKIMNSQTCTCGCKLTIAECRFDEGSCPVSQQLAAEIVRKIRLAAQHAATPHSAGGQ